jgi:hypothetical protein
MAAGAGVRPIETRYKGYRFRSRLEARWAVVFDAAGVEWHYEHEGYDLGERGWYLPDFWLPGLNTHVEVKPNFATAKWTGHRIEEQKLTAVCKATKTFGVFCTDLKDDSSFQALYQEFSAELLWPDDAQWPEAVKKLYATLDFDYLQWPEGDFIPGGRVLLCPICGEINTHIGPSKNIDGDYETRDIFPGADIHARGDAMAISLWGECGHQWSLVLAFHKGATDIGIVYQPEQDLSPIQIVVKPEHLQAGMSARFEHGETP